MAQQKIALITGAGRGLGEGMARHLTASGVTVLGTHRGGAHPGFLHLDVARFDTYPDFVAAVRDRLDGAGIDYLINNAGIGVYAPYAETTAAQFDALVDVNLKAPYFLTQHLLPLINDGGRVLNVTTAVTRGVVPGMSAYAAVKAAVEVLTRYQAAELAARSIRVNAIMGGAVETDFADGIMRADFVKDLAAHTIIQGRIATVDDITAAVPAILSDAFQWATGGIIDVSGGQSL
ncbi:MULTISPECIES: SDR family NAD(P)-dependent oxidoreductase [Catenuloplanes]|uniref:NAD(P)-dependent dehydrogenase (Short-subunit alcohol dehydrogenase family) n=1 Tax=Catenuloplanes niger TaxID=587534 RepID=A0AAE4CTA8_9ACTN|nr:SDR family oxidoreductase [Catenuloplanes niger]MDR7320534.1 NAD(P)-dependent dehydrogenase (short-subunit alcohol dehydrogenase family) [Catenuloplanes niger]